MAYLNGLWVEKPHEKAPDFVKAKMSINVEKMLETLKSSKEKYINLQLKESKDGRLYAEIDEWKPDKNEKKPEPITEEDSDLPDLPF